MEEQRDEALLWMQENKKGVRAALKEAERRWPALKGKRGYLDYAVSQQRAKKRVRFADETFHGGSRMLTQIEEDDLVAWCKQKNRKLDGAFDEDLNNRIIAVLTARQNTLRLFKGRRAAPLSTKAKEALKRGQVSKTFFRNFANRHASQLKKETASNMDSKRAKKATFSNAKAMLTEGSCSLYRELTELPDADGTPLVGTRHPLRTEHRANSIDVL